MLARLRKTALPVHPTLRHPDGLPIIALGLNRAGAPIWPVRGGAPDDDDDDGTPGQKDDDAKDDGSGQSDKGFPESTPLTEMTVEQREAYWKFQARKHEGVAKSRSDYDELKAKAADADRLRQERESESEKAIREAREQAAAEERAKNAPQLVQMAFRAAAKGALTDEARDALVEDLDLSKYLTDTGEVDIEKVEKKVAAVAPKRDEQQQRRFPDLGQGKRAGDAKPSVASGREMYEARRGSKAS